MEQVRVNLSLEQEVWERFSALVPNRKKSKIINELLKKEVKDIIHRSEEKELRTAFQEASKIHSASNPSRNGNPWMQKDGIK